MSIALVGGAEVPVKVCERFVKDCLVQACRGNEVISERDFSTSSRQFLQQYTSYVQGCQRAKHLRVYFMQPTVKVVQVPVLLSFAARLKIANTPSFWESFMAGKGLKANALGYRYVTSGHIYACYCGEQYQIIDKEMLYACSKQTKLFGIHDIKATKSRYAIPIDSNPVLFAGTFFENNKVLLVGIQACGVLLLLALLLLDEPQVSGSVNVVQAQIAQLQQELADAESSKEDLTSEHKRRQQWAVQVAKIRKVTQDVFVAGQYEMILGRVEFTPEKVVLSGVAQSLKKISHYLDYLNSSWPEVQFHKLQYAQALDQALDQIPDQAPGIDNKRQHFEIRINLQDAGVLPLAQSLALPLDSAFSAPRQQPSRYSRAYAGRGYGHS